MLDDDKLCIKCIKYPVFADIYPEMANVERPEILTESMFSITDSLKQIVWENWFAYIKLICNGCKTSLVHDLEAVCQIKRAWKM